MAVPMASTRAHREWQGIGVFLFVVLAARPAAAAPNIFDQQKLAPLFRAAQALDAALAGPAMPQSQVDDLRQKLEMESARSERLAASETEKLFFDLCTTAALEYQAARSRLQSTGSREIFDGDVAKVRDYLARAFELYTGKPREAPRPVVSEAPSAPVRVCCALKVDIPPQSASAPATTSEKPNQQPAHEPPEPPPPAAPTIEPPPVTPPPAATQPSPTPPRPAETPREAPPPRAMPRSVDLNDLRKNANRVKIVKKEDAVRGCDWIAPIAASAGGSGAYEIAGHNFFYADVEELAKLKTAELGGDTYLLKEKSKTELSGDAYRCASR